MTRTALARITPARTTLGRLALIMTVLALCAPALAPIATAQPLPEPQGPVVLTVDGAIDRADAEGTARFDLDMLRALGTTEIVTDTIWTSGTHRFVGVPLHRLLDHLGAGGDTLRATAINAYSVEIPASDAVEDGPILAFEMDGAVMSRRDKGPLWVVYPYAAAPEYRTEVIYGRSIWQLDRLTVIE